MRKSGGNQGSGRFLAFTEAFKSFITQLKKEGKELKEEYIFPGAWEFDDGVKAYERYKQLEEKPTAILP